ncbi:MAG: beta-hexosaminidase [Oscillospiraceae bacterium]|nr:beta-hexosaminidase [Oscillospiraceae bacterium]MBQ7130683.1 beta-hexosaminidase [Oscillospiraceae bacterium]
MRLISLLLMISFLLAGCSSQPQPEMTISSIPPATQSVSLSPAVPSSADPMQNLLDAMTTEEKTGQLFLARCPDSGAADDITRFHLGGYLLFGQDFDNETPDSMEEKIALWQFSSPIPLLIAVDEEGGSVCRVSSHPAFRHSRFPSPRESYTRGGMESVLAAETEKASLLHSLGVNVAMGPVCDVTTRFDAFMYDRSLGESPEVTGRFAANTLQIYQQHRLGSVLKHFPGYGNNDDTHVGLVLDDRPLEELENADLIPFAEGIRAGADAILVSHTIVAAFDEELPASLSPAVHDYLRNTMGFSGVIITDDLAMEAISDIYGPEEAAVLAVLAGNDLLCSSEYHVQYPAVLEAVQDGRIPMAQLDASVMRILQWKKDLGLIF